MDRAKLIAYTQSYLSFLFANMDKNKIKNIILFGSVARGEFTTESDVDLFIETNESKIVKSIADRALTLFLESDIYTQWKLRGISNNIQIHVGILDKLSDLKLSLIADGITLYGKFTSRKQGDHFVLMAFKSIKNKAKRYRIERYLFGRNEKDRKVKGAVEECGGRKLTSRSLIIPSLHSNEVIQRLKSEKVDFVMFDIWGEL